MISRNDSQLLSNDSWPATASQPALTLADVRSLIQQHGSQSSANFLLQKNVQYFGNLSTGVIGFVPHSSIFGNTNIVFSNPVCAKENTELLLNAYLLHQKHPSLFLGVDRSVTQYLSKLGFQCNQIGVESQIALNEFELKGKSKKQLRHASNFNKRVTCEVKELPWKAVSSHQVNKLSRAWRNQKGISRDELKLLTRPPVFRDEPYVRKFYCHQGDKLLGFVFFEPYYENGMIRGYCANIIRSLTDHQYNGVSDFIILEAIKVFQQEGVRSLSLGLSPLYNISPEVSDRPSLRRLFKFMYQHANSIYSFKGLAYHKTRYRPTQEPWYLCSQELNLPRILSALFFGLGVL
ncbi:DUF2156 domain-containing protein [Litoribacillus peritrichatus]|uniref:Phosphatidylglycerol lysyltransferase C-terminal domain-containing protein n=1 Tax=Litoribacillus peritrichatus TaxID=718191 RepID=A0ABP7MA64_9GAMM